MGRVRPGRASKGETKTRNATTDAGLNDGYSESVAVEEAIARIKGGPI